MASLDDIQPGDRLVLVRYDQPIGHVWVARRLKRYWVSTKGGKWNYSGEAVPYHEWWNGGTTSVRRELPGDAAALKEEAR